MYSFLAELVFEYIKRCSFKMYRMCFTLCGSFPSLVVGQPAVSCNSIALCMLTSLSRSESPFVLEELQK